MAGKATIVLGFSLLVAGAVWAAEAPAPLTVRVVDAVSGQPVKRFTYEYGIDSPDRHEFPSRQDEVEAKTEDGVIRIPAPRRCSLWICATTPHHLPGNCAEFKVLPDDRKRTFTLKLTPGVLVRGVVLDAESGKPIAGAEVSPVFFGHPILWVCSKRAVGTDGNGRFELDGVDKSFGICVEHERYKTLGGDTMSGDPMHLDTKGGLNTIRLEPKPAPAQAPGTPKQESKPRLFGSVVDQKGNPVGPYRVVAATMPGPNFLFGNKEYSFEEEARDVPAGKPWELTLYSDGELYWVMAEAPGLAPSVQVVWHKDIARPIRLRLQPGFSLSGKVEGPGVAAGKAVVMVQPMYLFDSNPAYQHHRDSPLYAILVSRAGAGRDGLFRIGRLAPGSYLLQVISPGATPLERLVTLRDKDIRLAAPLKLVPAGRIEGVVYGREGELMVMESCHWSPPVTLDLDVGKALWGKYSSLGGSASFTTDEKGRFVLANVPAGRNTVGFSYNILIDVIGSHDHLLNVLPGRTTEVRINVPPGSELCWKLPVEVTVGDGSRKDVIAGCGVTNPEFFKPPAHTDPETLGISLAFEPLPGQAVSWPALDEATLVEIPSGGGPGGAVLEGVCPGKYRVTTSLGRWSRCCDLGEPLLCQTVEVKPGMKEPLRIRLPAASVEVDFEHPKEDVKRWGVLLMALGEDGKPARQEFTGYGDSVHWTPAHLRPCLDFMPPGRYTLLAWRDGLGWARCGPVLVEAGRIADAGVLKFRPGGTIRGRMALPEVCALPHGVSAVDSSGVRIEAEVKWTHEGYTFVAKDLWPGKWTVSAVDGDRNVLAQRRVELKGTETVEVK